MQKKLYKKKYHRLLTLFRQGSNIFYIQSTSIYYLYIDFFSGLIPTCGRCGVDHIQSSVPSLFRFAYFLAAI